MGKLSKDNFKKTIYYLQKNGWKNTLYAAAERLQKHDTDSYTYIAPKESVLRAQRESSWDEPVSFSILVPLYHTPKAYFMEMVESVLSQTYPYFQLVLLDAGEEEKKPDTAGAGTGAALKKAERMDNRPAPKKIEGIDTKPAPKEVEGIDTKPAPKKIEKFGTKAAADGVTLGELAACCNDNRICYHKLSANKGIAENTNAGLEYATGDYIALLDHDDMLTADALYELAAAIEEGKKRGVELQMLYSDEDKCDGNGLEFYEPHFKPDFNLDLLLTNNYICHFTAVKAELFRELQLRGEFNGAQDFDLVLRVAGKLLDKQEQICHIPRVLYHWRCHRDSTAANPASKTYAYEAGKRAVENFLAERGWKAHVEHLKHLGFYRVIYEEDIFSQRPDIGAVGGSLLNRAGRLTGGMRSASGQAVYEGLKYGFSGYMNRAVLVQQAEVLDIRCMLINPACQEVFEKSLQDMGLTLEDYKKIERDSRLPEKEADLTRVSLRVSRALRETGYRLIWDPQWIKRIG